LNKHIMIALIFSILDFCDVYNTCSA
jgi:hypothetical protein